MRRADFLSGLDPALAGEEMHALIRELYPICRSITGDGVRRTLESLRSRIPLEIHEVPSGTQVLDWTVPREWNIREAYIEDAAGRRVVDFGRSNLHVMGYSVPVRATLKGRDLKAHCHHLPDKPDWIPYKTSFYRDAWGFCMTAAQFASLEDDGEYLAVIDSTLEDGHLTYGELFLPGDSGEEILISCHVCHPSLCNDNLSGISLAATLARHLAPLPRRYGYRFLFLPVTIGAITWLARNEDAVRRIRHGMVVTLVGDPGATTYKKSRRGDAAVDRAMAQVLRFSGADYRILDFIPYGYDERQFCSPGFDLPMGCLMRTPFGEFPEYHTSADDLDFVRPRFLADSLAKCAEALEILENDRTCRNLFPKGEPQLGRRGLYGSKGGGGGPGVEEMSLLWVLNQSDGGNSLLDIAERSGIRFRSISAAAAALSEAGMLEECREPERQGRGSRLAV